MKKILILLLFSLTGCVMMPKKYEPQPIVLKEIANNPGAVKIGSLSLYAEEYESQTGIDFSNAGMKLIMLTFQNISQSGMAATHQIFSGEIHGIGAAEYMPYPYLDALALLENSETIKEGIKGAAVGTGTGALIGAAIGAIGGAIVGDPGSGAAIGALTGGASGGFKSVGHYKNKMMQAIGSELRSRALPEFISVPPNSKIAGLLFYPQDISSLKTTIEGKTYYIGIH